VGLADPQLPLDNLNYKIGSRKKENWWDKIKPFVELCGVILLAVYTGYTIKIYSANKKAADVAQRTLVEIQQQTMLIRQQLVGTEAAVVVINDFPGIESAQTNNYGFNIGFRNDGHVVASRVNVTLVVRRETVDGAKPIGEPWHCDFDLSPIPPTKVEEHQCFLKGMDKREWRPIGDFRQTIAVDGSFFYWNGFEAMPNQLICLRYVPSGLKSKFGSEGPGRFVFCDRYPAWIEYLKARMAGNGEKQPPQ
jgi:hypothetical protein